MITCAALGLLYSVSRFAPEQAVAKETASAAHDMTVEPLALPAAVGTAGPARRRTHRVTQALWSKFTS